MILFLHTFINSSDTSNEKIDFDRVSVRTENKYIVADTFSINGYDFVLKDGPGLSKLEVIGDEIEVIGKLELQSPSFIVRRHQSKDLLFFSYPSFNVDRIYMLAGTELDSLERVHKGIPMNEVYAFKIQGLVLSNNKFYLTGLTGGGAKAKGYSSDEKDFYGLAEMFAKEQK